MKIIKAKADWCGPCRILDAQLDGFNKCPIEVLNIGLDPDKAKEYGIRSIPTMIIVDDSGTELWRHSGLISKFELEKIVTKLTV